MWLRSYRRDADRFLRLSWGERRLLAEALWHLGWARLAVLFVPFQRIVSRVGARLVEPAAPLAAGVAEAEASRVGWAVRAVAARTPWTSACLVQGLAAQRMLRRRRIPSTLYLGVAQDAGGRRQLDAHAWLRCGELILTGAAGYQRYTVVASFLAE